MRCQATKNKRRSQRQKLRSGLLSRLNAAPVTKSIQPLFSRLNEITLNGMQRLVQLLRSLHQPRLEKRALVLGSSLGVAALAVSAIVSQALVVERGTWHEPAGTSTVSRTLTLDSNSTGSESLPAADEADSALGFGAVANLPQPEPPEAPLHEQVLEIGSGDSLALIFDRAGFSPRQLYDLVSQSGEGETLSRIYPGRELVFRGSDEGELVELEYRISALESLLIRQSESGYVAEKVERIPDSFPTTRSGQIESSFYMAGKAAGLTDNLIMELAALFGWDIDFALEIRRGDSFRVIYEDLYLDGELIGHGDILAAEFINQGDIYRAVRHIFADGSIDYYTPEGESMRKAFLRTPLDVFRISSHFDPYRKHPVLNTIRAHNGTDYAAPTGTPIRATGDGRVVSARFSSSYGNVVEIQHGENYRTLYAHMNRFASGIRNGSKVEQGQIIGYVGMTGLATGPHLHFEFHVNGTVRNPVTVELPNGDPLQGAELDTFRTESVALIQMLDNPALRLADSSDAASSPL